MTRWTTLSDAIAGHPLLGTLGLEPMTLAGFDAWGVERVEPGRALEAWRAAAALAAGVGGTAVLTHADHVHPDIEDVVPRPACSLEQARREREEHLRQDEEAAALLEELATAEPQPEPYEERDVFLEDPLRDALGLAIVRGGLTDAVLPFTGVDDGNDPSQEQLRAFLDHFHATVGAVPIYASGSLLELELSAPPQDLEALRAMARDMLRLSVGRGEGWGLEAAPRLLRRLAHDRWVVWWYGT